MKTVVFDFDGTLVDSSRDIAGAFCASLKRFSLDPPPLESVYPLIGRPLSEMYAGFAEPAQIGELIASYRAIYPTLWTENTRPFQGVTEVLSGLRTRGYRLAVATTKGSDTVRAIAAELGLASYFDYLQGTDGFAHKPAPDVVLRALTGAGGTGAWMVGDTVADILAGKAAGLKTYAVTWGTHDEATLQTAEPDVLEPNINALLDVL